MFRDEYASELDYLYQLTGEVAEKHPTEAPLLGRDASPAVSRLLQTAAFLFARLRQRLDDDLPEVIHPVIESLMPSLLRPTPSATIMELRPAPGLKAPLVVEAGAPFASKPIDGAPCVFRSTDEIRVLPWRLERVELASERRELRLGLALLPGAKIDPAPVGSALRLFFSGPTAMALDARSALLRGVRDVSAHDARGRSASLVGAAPLLSGTRPEQGEGDGPSALAALRMYFAWPAAFAFLDVPNLDNALALLGDGERIEIRVGLSDPLARSIRLDTDTVRLHCVGALNLQRLPDLVHVPVRSGRCHVPLPRPGMRVHSIGRVTLVQHDLTTRPAVPFAAVFPPVVDPDGAPQIMFATERRASVLGRDPIVSLAFQGAGLERVGAAKLEVDVIDGDRAERLGLGDVAATVPGSPSLVTFENITPASRPLPAVFDGDRLWRWLQLLKLPLHELAAPGELARCLALANAPAWAAWPDAKPDADTFTPLVGVSMHTEAVGERTAAVSIDVDPGGFAGLGDADLFGEVVQRLLATTLRPHERVELTLRDAARSPVLRYAAIPGTREGL